MNAMQIADLCIENFRGIRIGHIRFGAHTVFIGPNYCGKTTVIEALALLFGRDRMVRSLTEHDFFEGDPQPADRIRLVATIIGFDGDEPADHTDWFRDDRGVIKWWNPATGAVSATRDDPTWQLACQIGFSARFDRPSLEVETARYFHDDDAMADVLVDEVWTAVPARLIRDIGFFLVPASRTWDRVVSFGSELFRRVVASGAGQTAESVLGERDRLRAPQQPLEADAHLEPIIARLNAELAGFFRTQPRLHLRVTATDSDGLLEAVVRHYAQAGTALALPARRHGSGLISLQHLLLLLQFGRQRAEAHEGFWMALEEPELHVPPPLQRRLVHRIQAL
jgi:putative ATP-dependent endonuclease of the OLD family